MKFHLFTDGACQPNPGNGGWAFIVYPETHPKKRSVLSGYEPNTTNNRMEMTAVLKGLEYLSTWNGCRSESLQDPPEVVLFSDSKYLINGIEIWMHNWSKNGWKKKDDNPVLNDDLWKEIYELSQSNSGIASLRCEHIKGHSGHPENEECDQLAVAEISKNQ